MTTAAARSLHGDDVVSLSGGIDSPAVAAYAAPIHRERTGTRLPALSVVYPNFPEIDESAYIHAVVDRLDLELHTYEESAKTLDEVDDWMAVLDGPVPQFFLAESAEHYRKARSMGFRTMLTGELAEWFVERRDYLIPHLLLHGRFRPLVDHLGRQRRLHGVGPKGIARQLGAAFVTPRIERAWTRVRPAAVEMPAWIDEARLRRVEARYATPARERWSAFQVALFTGPDLAAEAEDIVQAVTGMRVRRPFGDQDLIEFFLRLPAEQKFPDTHYKGLLRRLLRGRLPDQLLDRPSKAVFNRAVLARADDEALRRLLLDPPHRIPGVRYDVLAERLTHGGFEISEYEWTKNLAATHAWLARW
jgi:asparagine synthase (glutamine-hydrolysing)